MHNLQNDVKATTKLPMDIPKDLLDLDDKTTYVYKDLVRVVGAHKENLKHSGPSPRTHKVRESSSKIESSKERKKQLAKKQYKKVHVKGKSEKKFVEKEHDSELEELFKEIDETAVERSNMRKQSEEKKRKILSRKKEKCRT